jgi:hypothetical protein
MRASPEVLAWLNRLKAERSRLGTRNKYLAAAMAVGVLLLAAILWQVHAATIGAYAVIDNVTVEQNPANQGQLQIRFRVVSPGKVYCRRTSGRVQTDLVDHFRAACEVTRPWSWIYQPGSDIDVSLWYRRGPFPCSEQASFATAGRADIVVLIDTTGSMDASIAALQEKCATFSEQLAKQNLEHRLALIGFGDAQEGEWLDKHPFTADVAEFRRWVEALKRFDGGDPPESALDAIEEALALPLEKDSVRWFYLVTDATYHTPSRSGATPAGIAARLAKERVLLRVFSKPEFEADYAKLLGEPGKFEEIENFGNVLSEGRVLE